MRNAGTHGLDTQPIHSGDLLTASSYAAVQVEPAGSAELTILMPCLDEAETIAACVTKARGFLARTGIRGEVLVADNGSRDGSREIAQKLGARIIEVPQRGYGAALIQGIWA